MSAVAPPPLTTGRRRAAIGLVVACQGTQALILGGLGLFLPLIRADLDLSFTQAGALGAVSTLVYATMQLPAGYLADRFGARPLFLGGLVATNFLALLFALLDSFELAVANQAASGFFRALVFAPGILLITTLFPADRRATAMGLYVAGGFSSSVLLNLVGPWLVGPLGWRGVFALFAGLGLLLTGLLWRLGPGGLENRVAPARLRDAVALLRQPAVWLLAVIQYVRLAVVLGLGLWLPSVLIADKGYSLATAGVLMAVSAAMTAPANFLGGWVSDRTGRPLAVIGASVLVLGLSTAALVPADSLWLLVPVVAVNGLVLQLYFGPLFSVPIDIWGARTAGLFTGFGNFWANLGGVTSAYLLGVVKDRTGSFDAGLLVLAGLCGVSLVATAVLHLSTRRRVLAAPV